MDGFWLLVELHREWSASAAYAAGMYFSDIGWQISWESKNSPSIVHWPHIGLPTLQGAGNWLEHKIYFCLTSYSSQTVSVYIAKHLCGPLVYNSSATMKLMRLFPAHSGLGLHRLLLICFISRRKNTDILTINWREMEGFEEYWLINNANQSRVKHDDFFFFVYSTFPLI